jgi:hypothetical protein
VQELSEVWGAGMCNVHLVAALSPVLLATLSCLHDARMCRTQLWQLVIVS